MTEGSDLSQLGNWDIELREEVMYDGRLGGYPDTYGVKLSDLVELCGGLANSVNQVHVRGVNENGADNVIDGGIIILVTE